MIELSQPEVECSVFTEKAGALSALGHNLELIAERVTLRAAEDLSGLTLEVHADSLRVVTAASAGDKRTIEETAANTVLGARKFPKIRFVSSAIERREGGYRISGELELHGARRVISADVQRAGDWLQTEVTLHQPDFGITPYSAMFGALKVKPDVRVVVRVSARSLKVS